MWSKRSVSGKLRQRAVRYYLAGLKKLSGADRERAERRIMEHDPKNGRMNIAIYSRNIAVAKELAKEQAMQHNASEENPFERRIDFSFKSSNTLQDVVAFFEKDVFNGQVKITVADRELLKKAAPRIAASDIEARKALELICEGIRCKVEINTRAKTVAISKM